jgi:hypothetical protein
VRILQFPESYGLGNGLVDVRAHARELVLVIFELFPLIGERDWAEPGCAGLYDLSHIIDNFLGDWSGGRELRDLRRPIREGDGPQGRIHLERTGNAVRVIEGISPQYAAGLLSGLQHAELDIYCEDDTAKNILASALPNDVRSRVQITPIGSAAAVVRQLAARYREKNQRAACGLLDGDQALKKPEHVSVFLGAIETVKDRDKATEWIENRIAFLPGNARPERWLTEVIKDDVSENLAADFGVTKEVLTAFIEEAVSSTDHTEIYVMSQRLNLSTPIVESRLVRAAIRRSADEIADIVSFVKGFLG